MSYCSENRLPLTTPINRLWEIIDLLGFQKIRNSSKIEDQIGAFIWIGNNRDITFVALELYVYKKDTYISVQTRTRAGRSYWDLRQQNKTISLLRGLFGGSFTTDEGVNRYMTLDTPEPSKIACSLYLDRWRFHNAIQKPRIYLDSRNMMGDIAKEEATGLPWLDDMNPRVLSNNMILPYLIGCWESYFRNSFISIIKYANNVSPRALKNCRISTAEYMRVIHGEVTLENILADSLSFQRPNIISENFRALDLKIDIAAWLKKPYHKGRKSLFDSITEIVETRDIIRQVKQAVRIPVIGNGDVDSPAAAAKMLETTGCDAVMVDVYKRQMCALPEG